jgi:hypothetical protein
VIGYSNGNKSAIFQAFLAFGSPEDLKRHAVLAQSLHESASDKTRGARYEKHVRLHWKAPPRAKDIIIAILPA